MNQTNAGTSFGFPKTRKALANSAVWLGSMFMLALQLIAGSAHAVVIPTGSFTCTQAKSATTVCVGAGYYASGWTSGTGYWQYTLNTVGYTGAITMTFSNTKSSAGGPTAGQVYYNIGAGDVAVSSFPVTTTCTSQTITLPAACSGVSNLIVKVVMTGATVSTATHRITSDNVFDAASTSCTTAPTAGSVAASANPICGGSSTVLTLTGASGGAGISHQWQSSADNINWTDITGATGQTYTTPALNATAYYRVVTTCAAVPASPATTASYTVNVNTVTVAAITGYNDPLLVDGTDTLSDATSGGVWSSSNTSVATVNASGIITGVFGGSAVISYKVTNPSTGCVGTASVNVNVVWTNTLALYAGVNGNSTAVIPVPGDSVSALYAVGFGSNTLCGSGGLSGLTVNLANTSVNEDSAHVGYKVYPKPGKALNLYRIHARARVSSTGPKKARIGFQFWSNGSGSGWLFEDADETLVSGTCGNSANSWDFNTGVPANPNPTFNGITDSLEVAVFPFAPDTTTGTFQLNTLETYGIVSNAADCNAGSIVTNLDSVYPAVATICDSGYRFLNYNIGTGGISGVGIEYQWQVSTTSPTTGFTDVPDANGVVYQTPTLTVGTASSDTFYYRMKITCTISNTSSFSEPNILTIHATPANAGVISGAVASTGLPFDHMLIPTNYTLTSTVSGGTWSSNDTSTISINPTTGVATPHIPGDAIITYRTNVNGCTGTSKDTFVAYYPNTKALYVGRNGNSRNVYASTDASVSNLNLANWDSATACSSGGYSGLVNTNTSFNTATNGIASINVTSATGFNASAIYATVRQQAALTNNYKVRLAYSTDGGTTWVFGAENSADHDDCGYSSTAILYTFPSPIAVSTTPVKFALFGYNGVSTASTLQINSLDVIGTGSALMKGTGIGNIEAAASDIQLYPNPVENTLNIASAENVNVVILSIDGKKLLEQKNVTSVNVSSLASGMYMIQLYNVNNNTLLKADKFIKK